MNDQIRAALVDLALSVIHGIKIFLVYILPSAVVALPFSPDFQHFMVAYPVVNTLWAAVANAIKNRNPDNSKVQSIL